MTTGIALKVYSSRAVLTVIQSYMDEALGHPDAVTDPDATRLCAALALVQQAIEILEEKVDG